MPEDDNLWDSTSIVEFKNHLLGRVTASMPAGVTGNAVLTRQISVSLRTTDSVLVQLVGPHSATDTEIGFAVVAEESTAVEGEHYAFASSSSTVTIPANSSQGHILINPVSGSIPSGNRRLVLELTGNDLVPPSENYKRFTLTLVP